MVQATREYWEKKVQELVEKLESVSIRAEAEYLVLQWALDSAKVRLQDSELELVQVKQKAQLRESELEMALDLARAKALALE